MKQQLDFVTSVLQDLNGDYSYIRDLHCFFLVCDNYAVTSLAEWRSKSRLLS